MIRTTDHGTVVWFQLQARPTYKVAWGLEQFLAYLKVSETEPELRCQLWDSGEISELTDVDRRELHAAIPVSELKKYNAKKAMAAGAGK